MQARGERWIELPQNSSSGCVQLHRLGRDRCRDMLSSSMIEQPSPVPGPRRTGETPRHLGLKALAAQWALGQGLSFVAPEVSFPHRRFRVDLAACAPTRKAPSRKPVPHLSSVLKAAVVFECKQVRGDLIRDNKRRALLSERLKTLEARRQRLEALLHFICLTLRMAKPCFVSSTAIACGIITTPDTRTFCAKFASRNTVF